MRAELDRNLRFNFIVNLLDGGSFGFAIGIASFVTVIPLFVNTLSNSVILIGLIPAIHSMGWQLPQLLTGHRVARLTRYKPMTVLMTVNERLPFLGLAAIAYFLPGIGTSSALALTYTMLVWQGLGGGFTATSWQLMVGKVFPPNRIGTFYGMQSAMANLFAAIGAFIAGILIQNLAPPMNYSLCFLIAGAVMIGSLVFIASTREPHHEPVNRDEPAAAFWRRVRTILATDGRFRQFMLARILLQLGTMAFAFYIIYAVRAFAVSPEVAGFMTTVYMATQIIANPVMGWIGDRTSQLLAMLIGAGAAALSVGIALVAPNAGWFYAVFILAGIANVGLWTAALAMTLEFGTATERPAYIGLTNTLLAPLTIGVPVLGGWLAEHAGYSTTFLVSLAGLGATGFVLSLMLRERARQARAVADTAE